jgi:hypothetical protein
MEKEHNDNNTTGSAALGKMTTTKSMRNNERDWGSGDPRYPCKIPSASKPYMAFLSPPESTTSSAIEYRLFVESLFPWKFESLYTVSVATFLSNRR